jgi:hypothetical protein
MWLTSLSNTQLCAHLLILKQLTPKEETKSKRTVKLSVLMDPKVAAIFDSYCLETGYKKSTLIVKLIKDHLIAKGHAAQLQLPSIQPSKL